VRACGERHGSEREGRKTPQQKSKKQRERERERERETWAHTHTNTPDAKKSIIAEKISGFISPHEISSEDFVTVTKSGPKKTALTPSILNSALASGDFMLCVCAYV
jgi:hypothetical protein